MTFDEWMRGVNPLHEPTDGGMETRLLRSCWDAAAAAAAERCAKLCEDSNVFEYDDPGGYFARLIRDA